MSAIPRISVRCACCTKATVAPKRYFLLQARTGRIAVDLCGPCSSALSWRADEAILLADDFKSLPRIFAGPPVRAIWRRLLEATEARASQNAVRVATQSKPAQTDDADPI